MTSESWTKHHFETVAGILDMTSGDRYNSHGRLTNHGSCWGYTVRAFANYFEAANYRFARSRFLRACGMGNVEILNDQQQRAKEQLGEEPD